MTHEEILDKLRSLRLIVDDLHTPQTSATNRIRKSLIYEGLSGVITALESEPGPLPPEADAPAVLAVVETKACVHEGGRFDLPFFSDDLPRPPSGKFHYEDVIVTITSKP